MPTGFLIAPARLVRGENSFPEYRDIQDKLLKAAVQRGQDIWGGFKFGGIRPRDKEFGISQFRPKDMFGGGTATFSKTFGSAGSWTDIFNYVVPRDMVHSFAGVGIPDPSLIFASLRFQLADNILPIVNIEEAHLYDSSFALLFNEDQMEELVVPELNRVLFRGFQERGTRSRTQRVVPLGFALYRAKDLVIREQETGN